MKKNIFIGLLLSCLLITSSGCMFGSKCPGGDPAPEVTSDRVSLKFYKDPARYQQALQQQGTPSYSDPFAIKSAVREGNLLKITVSYGGGCSDHNFELIWNGALTRSLPAQATLFLKHNANGDVCKALLTKTLVFNIREKMEMPGEQVRIHLINASNKETIKSN